MSHTGVFFSFIALGMALILAGQLLRWILPPINIRRKHRIALRPRWEPTQTEHLTPEVQQFIGEVVRQFAAEGFGVAANLFNAGSVGDVRGLNILLVNRANGDIAVVIVAAAKFIRSLNYFVKSEFTDGTRVVTGCSRGIGIYPRDPSCDGMNFSWVRDVRTLCEAHRRRLQKLGRVDEARVTPAPGEEVKYFDDEWVRETRRYANLGYTFLDERIGAYRYTWKGACLSSWKLSEPVKRWRIGLQNRQARRAWREIGMDTRRPDTSTIQTVLASEGDQPVAAPDAKDLAYETSLAEGEFRYDTSASVALSIRIGMPSAGQVLARQWVSFCWITFWGVALSLGLYRRYQIHLAAQRFPMWVPPELPLWVQILPVVMAAFLIAEVVKVLFRVGTARGTVVLTATPEALTFRNAPARVGSGRIAREDLDSLLVTLARLSLHGRVWRLEARRYDGGKRQTLVLGQDFQALTQARDALLRAMGIEHADAAPAQAAAG